MMPEPPPAPDGAAPPMPAVPAPVPVPEPPAGAGRGPKGLPAVDWSFPRALVVGVVTNLVLAQLIVGAIAFVAFGIASEEDPETVYVGLIADAAWLAFLLFWLQRWHVGWRERIGLVLGRIGRRDGVFGVVAGLLLYPIIALAIAVPLTILFSAISGSDATTPDQLPSGLSGGTTVASVILAVLVAPVVEELYFRGVLFRSIRDRHGFWIGAVTSGVIFGFVHYVPAPWQDAVLLQSIMVCTGIALAWIYERRGNLVASIAAHMAFNAVGIVLILGFG